MFCSHLQNVKMDIYCTFHINRYQFPIFLFTVIHCDTTRFMTIDLLFFTKVLPTIWQYFNIVINFTIPSTYWEAQGYYSTLPPWYKYIANFFHPVYRSYDKWRRVNGVFLLLFTLPLLLHQSCTTTDITISNTLYYHHYCVYHATFPPISCRIFQPRFLSCFPIVYQMVILTSLWQYYTFIRVNIIASP